MTVCASKFNLTLLVVALFFTAARADEPVIRQTREADATLVLFNTHDPESRALAEYYAERRRVPA